MTVTFRLDLLTGSDPLEVSEDVLAAGWDGYRALVERQYPLEGIIVIEVAGQPVLEVHDELWAATQNLCFSAVSAVLGGERDCFLYRFTSSDGHIAVVALATLVRLFGDTTPTVTAAKAELLPALYATGVRCVELFRRLSGDHAHQADYLAPFAERAAQSLRQAGLLA
jgi:hypothetical protein